MYRESSESRLIFVAYSYIYRASDPRIMGAGESWNRRCVYKRCFIRECVSSASGHFTTWNRFDVHEGTVTEAR